MKLVSGRLGRWGRAEERSQGRERAWQEASAEEAHRHQAGGLTPVGPLNLATICPCQKLGRTEITAGLGVGEAWSGEVSRERDAFFCSQLFLWFRVGR